MLGGAGPRASGQDVSLADIFGLLLSAPPEGPSAAALADLLVATLKRSAWSAAKDLGAIAWQLLERSSFQEEQERRPSPASAPHAPERAERPSHAEQPEQDAATHVITPESGEVVHIRAYEHAPLGGQRQGDGTINADVAEVHVEEEEDAEPKRDTLAYLVLLLERLVRQDGAKAGKGGDQGVRRWRTAKLDFLADELSMPYRLASSRSTQLVTPSLYWLLLVPASSMSLLVCMASQEEAIALWCPQACCVAQILCEQCYAYHVSCA